MSNNSTYKNSYEIKRNLLLLIGVASISVISGIILTRVYIMDDALITLRYSFNFARFGIPIWNQADIANPSMGYTSLIWMGLNTIPALFTSNKDILIIAAKVFSFLALMGIIFILCKDISTLSISLPLKILVVLLIFTQFGYGLHVNSAMETMLFALLMLLTVRSYGNGNHALAYVFAALTFLTRPEGAILYLLVFMADLIKHQYKRIAIAGAGFVVLLAGLYFLLMGWYGDFLPNTFYAKQEVFNLTSLKRTLFFFVTVALPYLPFSLYAAFRMKNKTSLFMLFVSLVYCLYYLSVDPIMNVMSRYQWPCLLLLTVASFPAIEVFLKSKKRTIFVSILVLLVGVGINAGNALGARYFAGATGHSEANIINIGKTMAGFKEPEMWLIYHDAGAVCYFSDWNTHETIGLTNGELARKQTTLNDIYSDPKAVIALQNFDLTSESQFQRQETFTEKMVGYGFEHITDIPVLHVEGQRNFVVSMYSRDRSLAESIINNLDINTSYEPDFTYKLYQIAKNIAGR